MRQLPVSLVLALSLGLGSGLAACGGDDGDDGTAIDAANGIDADTSTLNGCTRADALDRTGAAAARTITTPGIAYTPPCIRIKVGQEVVWNSDFGFHPLSSGSPATGPQAGSPIPSTTSGNTVTVQFTAAGDFGYYCTTHGTSMMGVVYVEP